MQDGKAISYIGFFAIVGIFARIPFRIISATDMINQSPALGSPVAPTGFVSLVLVVAG